METSYIQGLEDFNIVKMTISELPCGPVVKNVPCNSKNKGLIPSWETKITHIKRLLSP